MARSSHCGCCGNTIVLAAVPTPRCLDGPASLRPLTSQSIKLARIHVRRKSVKKTRMCPLWSYSRGKWSNSRSSGSRRRTDAVPMALYTNLAKVEQARKQGAPSIADSQVSESISLRLGVAKKIISPSKLLRVGVDVNKGVDLLRFLSTHETAILCLQVLVFLLFFLQVGFPLLAQLLESGV